MYHLTHKILQDEYYLRNINSYKNRSLHWQHILIFVLTMGGSPYQKFQLEWKLLPDKQQQHNIYDIVEHNLENEKF